MFVCVGFVMCVCMCWFCNVCCVCVGFVMCVCMCRFCNVCLYVWDL